MNKKKHNKVYYIEQRRKKNKRKSIKKSNSKTNYFENLPIKNTFNEKIKKLRFRTILVSSLSSVLFTLNPITTKAINELESNTSNNYDVTDYNNYEDIKNSLEDINELDEENRNKIRNQERIDKYDYYVEIYANYFNLKSDNVIKAAHSITKNYTEFSEEKESTDKEYFAMNFVFDLYRGMYEEYGFYKDKLSANNEIITLNEEKILSNGYTFDEYLTFVSSMIGIDSNLVLAISHYETGYQSSNLALTQNNFGGIVFGNDFATFPTPEAGIIYEVYTVKRILENEEINNLTDLSAVYVNGNINKPSKLWEDSVSYIYKDLTDLKIITLKK